MKRLPTLSEVGPALLLTASVLGCFAACSAAPRGIAANRGTFRVNQISTGRGQVYPFRIRQVDSFGNPTSTILQIEDEDTLRTNATGGNPVLPVATFDTSPVLPDGRAGNQFLNFQFSNNIGLTSILSTQLADQTTNSGLTSAASIFQVNPSTEESVIVRGRGFVNGFTYYLNGGALELVQAVRAAGDNVEILDPRANGFPQFEGAADLVTTKSFVFIPDLDDNLASIETFPQDQTLRVVVTNAVRNTENKILIESVCTATTVGPGQQPA